jgi:hypothetical protein
MSNRNEENVKNIMTQEIDKNNKAKEMRKKGKKLKNLLCPVRIH